MQILVPIWQFYPPFKIAQTLRDVDSPLCSCALTVSKTVARISISCGNPRLRCSERWDLAPTVVVSSLDLPFQRNGLSNNPPTALWPTSAFLTIPRGP